jgi:hypothetical protein
MLLKSTMAARTKYPSMLGKHSSWAVFGGLF